MSTIGAAASAPTQDSHARRARRNRYSSMPSGTPIATSSRLAHATSSDVCPKRCSTCSSTMMRGIAAAICDGSGTMKALMTPPADQQFDDGEGRQQRQDADDARAVAR